MRSRGDPRRLAACRGARTGRRDSAVDDLIVVLSKPALSPSIAPTSIPASKSSIGEFARADFRDARGAGGKPDAGAHKVRARSRTPARINRRYVERSSTARCGASTPIRSISSSSIGGTMHSPAASRRCGLVDDLRQSGKIVMLGGTNFDTPHLEALLEADIPLIPCRSSIPCSIRVPRTGSPRSPAAWRRSPLLRHGRRRISVRPLAGPAGADRRARTPLAGEIQAYHRRFRRMDAVPGTAREPAPRRRPARRRYRHGREPRGSRSTGRRRRDRRRELAGISKPIWPSRRSVDRGRPRRDRRRSARRKVQRANFTNSSGTGMVRMAPS